MFLRSLRRCAPKRAPVNKGIRERAAVPDRIKEVVGALDEMKGRRITKESEATGQGMQVVGEVMKHKDHIRTMHQLDRVRIHLEELRKKETSDIQWDEFYVNVRHAEMCGELELNETDRFKNERLWIELAICEEQRVCRLVRFPNGIVAMPAFTSEYWLDTYQLRMNPESDTLSFLPVTETSKQNLKDAKFPVCFIGNLKMMCGLATMSLEQNQFPIIINPGAEASKLMTYPEMVKLVGSQRLTKAACRDLPDEFRAVFDTSRLKLERVLPEEVPVVGELGIPMLAITELQMLLFKHSEVISVYLEKKSDSAMQVTVVVVNAAHEETVERLRKAIGGWSFFPENKEEVNITFAESRPASGDIVYDGEAMGGLWRSVWKRPQATELTDLDFDAPMDW